MITRFAPSLTGYLHLGHVLHMLYVWGFARARGATVISRIEDHDLSRRRPEYEAAILENMEWLGFVPDEGIIASNTDGRSDYRQSDCGDHYARVLQVLERRGLVYGCECSRKQIQEENNGGTPSPASAPLYEGALAERSADSGDAVPPAQELCYTGTCADKGLPLEGNTVRFRVPDGEVIFEDLRLGECRQIPKRQCGDFSLRDRQGQWTYQFACVCDDIRHGVDLVIRGEDILASTARQILLFQALEAPVPSYFHHPLICNEKGEKLSKRQRSESISQLRDSGITAEKIIGRAVLAGGLAANSDPLSLSEALTLVADWLA
jgi:glutamyl/glutaminyl-tRNA synthetase